MKVLQFSLVLSLVVMAAACNKEEQTPPVEAPAETVAPPAIEEAAPAVEGDAVEAPPAATEEAAPAGH